ncbi:MAG TPA: acyltransferase [Opitutaceae bacterium]|nr:acyltransferase [Opitutaceae bacterium]
MKNYIPCLDGIRGLLALWVFWGHLTYAVGATIPVLSGPSMAVDLFMVLSGFLMAWHWLSAEPKKRAGGSETRRWIEFWNRRFFRIAPLYYVLLLAALLLDARVSAAKAAMKAIYHSAAATLSGVAQAPVDSLQNVLAHLSFAFGLHPAYASNDMLPDWSLSLEMQFYLAFPLLVLLCRPTRIIVFSCVSVAIAVVAKRLFGYDGLHGMLATFPQPTLLILKLHVFAAGMALGWLVAVREARHAPHFFLALIIPLALLDRPVTLAIVGITALLVVDSPLFVLPKRLLGSKPFRILGDLSYAVYLVHLIPSYLILDALQQRGLFSHASPYARFGIATSTLTPVVFVIAFVLHHAVERPGILLGRHVGQKLRARPAETDINTDELLLQPVAVHIESPQENATND